MKLLLLALLVVVTLCSRYDPGTCTEKLQIACVDDFRAAYPICEKAAKAGGSDMIATLACMKYINKMQPECWPCVCMFAKDLDLPIKGCD